VLEDGRILFRHDRPARVRRARGGTCGRRLRRARSFREAKVHLQYVTTAEAIDLDRIDAWQEGVPRAETRTSRLARLAA
jgi:hypothetical protein